MNLVGICNSMPLQYSCQIYSTLTHSKLDNTISIEIESIAYLTGCLSRYFQNWLSHESRVQVPVEIETSRAHNSFWTPKVAGSKPDPYWFSIELSLGEV